jgi:hypothetical protein
MLELLSGEMRLGSSMVEQATHNRQATGSNPVRAINTPVFGNRTAMLASPFCNCSGDACIALSETEIQ